jgi:hypothetical protein
VIAVRGFAPPDEPQEPGPVAACDDPEPRGHGYWHRQCLGLSFEDGGLSPRGKGRGLGPKSPNKPGFADELRPCADAMLAGLGIGEPTCKSIEVESSKSDCERALRDLTSLALNVCADYVQESCALDVLAEGCVAQNVGELMEETASMILSDACHQASVCMSAVTDGTGFVDPVD